MQTDVVFFFDIRRISDPRTKNMNLVTTPDHFLNEINGLRRTAAGRRKKRFVRQEREAQTRFGFKHMPTLFNLGKAVQSQFVRRREKF
jgi:hypothetical protein